MTGTTPRRTMFRELQWEYDIGRDRRLKYSYAVIPIESVINIEFVVPNMKRYIQNGFPWLTPCKEGRFCNIPRNFFDRSGWQVEHALPQESTHASIAVIADASMSNECMYANPTVAGRRMDVDMDEEYAQGGEEHADDSVEFEEAYADY